MKYTPASMVIAEFEKVRVFCEVHTEAHETVKYRVYNTRWQHACGWNKFWLVLRINERQRKETQEYYGSLSHNGHLDFKGKLSYLLSVLVRISFLPLTNLHIKKVKVK